MTRTTQLAILLSILAVAIRLILIDQAYIDNWSWRQSDVAAIARNFYENGFDFAYPQIDWAGDQPGYVGTEFPILPFLAAICYKFLGVHEWIGRLQAVILFALSLPFFFLLVRDTWHGLPAHDMPVRSGRRGDTDSSRGERRASAGVRLVRGYPPERSPYGAEPGSERCRCYFAGETAAAWALVFYSFAPLSVMTSRCFMPDMPSLSLSIVGLYFFLRWIDHGKMKFLVAAAVTISLSILIKLPSAVIGAPLLFLAWQKTRWNLFRQPALWIFAAATLLPSAVWYWHAHDIAEKFYPHHFFGAGGIQLMSVEWYGKIAKQIVTSSLTPVLSTFALLGAFVTTLTRRARLFHCWLAAMVLFVIVVGYGNRHQWYQLPLVPIAATFAGAACAFVTPAISSQRLKIIWSILLAGSFGVFAFVYALPLYQSRSSALLRDLGLELKRATPKKSLIIAADVGDPTLFYYAERRGWHFLEKEGIYDGNPIDSRQAIEGLKKLRTRGATHLVFTSNTSWWLDYYRQFTADLEAAARVVERTPEFVIYQLEPGPR